MNTVNVPVVREIIRQCMKESGVKCKRTYSEPRKLKNLDGKRNLKFYDVNGNDHEFDVFEQMLETYLPPEVGFDWTFSGTANSFYVVKI